MEAPFRPLLLYHSSFIHTHESQSFFIAPSFADVVVFRGYISRYLRRVYEPAFSPSLMGSLTFAKSTILEVVEKRFSGGLSELEQRLLILRLICFLCMSGACLVNWPKDPILSNKHTMTHLQFMVRESPPVPENDGTTKVLWDTYTEWADAALDETLGPIISFTH